MAVVDCVMIFMNMNCRAVLCEFDSVFWGEILELANYINYYSVTGLITRKEQLEWLNSLQKDLLSQSNTTVFFL